MFWVDVYLLRSDIRMNDMVEVFVYSVQQPEQEFLGIMLGVTFELKGALRHHILQHKRTKEFCLKQTAPQPEVMHLFLSLDTVGSSLNIQHASPRCWWSAPSKRSAKVRVRVKRRHTEAFENSQSSLTINLVMTTLCTIQNHQWWQLESYLYWLSNVRRGQI